MITVKTSTREVFITDAEDMYHPKHNKVIKSQKKQVEPILYMENKIYLIQEHN